MSFHNTSPTVKYHGLLNQGATCYLNSVLQALFMTKDFREAVERHTSENPDTECIDRHLTTLFDNLKERTAYTNKITKKLGIDRVCEQRDAAEYYEKILRLTSPEAAQIFHGLLTHKTICSTCCTETDTDGAFWHLPLALVESFSEDYSVVNGIEEYFRASYFSGENQMYCDQCDGKSDATIKCVMKCHPEVLMLLLKRFEFDYRYMTYVKINRTVDVPCTLQIPKNQTYELYAVVEHFGDLRSGHYTATIKSQDDERWWSFNDDRVTSLDYQPFQVDNFEKSSSAYLLFYRRKNGHAADTCTQDIKEVSTPGGFPPATSDIYDQCQDAVKMKEREEVEWAAEAGNDTAVAVSIYRHEETGIKEIVSVGSRGVGLSPDLCYNAEDQGNDVRARQSRPYNHEECNEERNDLHPQDAQAEKQKDEGKIITDGEEDMGRNAEADDQAEMRETLSSETQLEESIKDQDNDGGRLDDVRQRTYINHDFKLEVSDRHAIHNKQDEMSDAQRRVMDVKTDKDGKTGDDEESEKKGKSLTKSLNRDVEHPDNEGLVAVRQNINEDLGGTREVGQDYDLKPVSVYKQADEERMKVDVKVDKEGKTVTDERGVASGREKLYNEFQDNGGVGDSEQNKQKDEQGRSIRNKKRELQREEKRDFKGDKKQKTDDKHAQRTATSERQQHFRQDVDDQNNGRLDDVRENRSEQKISVTHTRHKDVGVVKQAKEQENKRDEPTQNRADSSLRRAGLAGSRSLTENQGVGSVEKMRQGDSQPKARTEFNENTVEGRRGSKKSRTCYDGTQRSSETKYKSIQTVQGTSRDSIKSRVENNEGNVKRKSDEKTNAVVSLSEGVCNSKPSEAPVQVPQKHTTKRVTDNIQEENETNSTVHSNAKKKQNLSDTEEQAAEMEVMKNKEKTKKRKWWPFSASRKQHRKEKSKKNKTPGCFSLFQKSRKNAEQTSESD